MRRGAVGDAGSTLGALRGSVCCSLSSANASLRSGRRLEARSWEISFSASWSSIGRCDRSAAWGCCAAKARATISVRQRQFAGSGGLSRTSYRSFG